MTWTPLPLLNGNGTGNRELLHGLHEAEDLPVSRINLSERSVTWGGYRLTMRLGKLPYVTLWAVRFDEIHRFYRDILGLPVKEENPNFVMFDTKGSSLAFHRLTKAPRLDRQTVELHLEVGDVDEVYSALQRKGVKFDERPANRPWGTRMASFRDPEGYAVEIIGPLKQEESVKAD